MPSLAPRGRVEQQIQIAAPRERVFDLLTDVDQIQRWMPVTLFEPKVGGGFRFVRGQFAAQGEITSLIPPELVAYTWEIETEDIDVRSEVRFELDTDDGGTLVRLTHSGFEDVAEVERHAHGWSVYLPRLKAVAEGQPPGPDRMGHE